MRRMIAYRLPESWIDQLDVVAKSLRITKTSALEYSMDYCSKDEGFLSYALERRGELKPEVGDPLTDWLSDCS